MKGLNPTIFIIPIIALILVTILYRFFLNKATNKSDYKSLIVKMFIIALVLNLAWELSQGPLYSGFSYNAEQMSFCALASIADAVMVILLYYALTLIYKNLHWIYEFTVLRTILIMLIGGIGAVLAEAKYLKAGSWSYNDSMPIIPYTNVGLSPILQFIILPALIYFLSGYFQKITKYSSDSYR